MGCTHCDQAKELLARRYERDLTPEESEILDTDHSRKPKSLIWRTENEKLRRDFHKCSADISNCFRLRKLSQNRSLNMQEFEHVERLSLEILGVHSFQEWPEERTDPPSLDDRPKLDPGVGSQAT